METINTSNENRGIPENKNAFRKQQRSTKTLVAMATLTSFAYVVMFLSKALPSVAGFLDFDMKDAVLAIGGFLYGPVSAGLMVLAVSLIEFFTVGSSGIIGLLMNVISSGSFCCIAALIYWYRPSFKGAISGLTAGGLVMTVLMLLWNYAITPLYMDVPRDVVVGMMVPVFLPFNLVKAGLNMGFTLMLYPSVMNALSKSGLAPNPEEQRPQSKGKAMGMAVGILALFVVAALALTGII